MLHDSKSYCRYELVDRHCNLLATHTEVTEIKKIARKMFPHCKLIPWLPMPTSNYLGSMTVKAPKGRARRFYTVATIHARMIPFINGENNVGLHSAP